jgi:hypothetical protein
MPSSLAACTQFLVWCGGAELLQVGLQCEVVRACEQVGTTWRGGGGYKCSRWAYVKVWQHSRQSVVLDPSGWAVQLTYIHVLVRRASFHVRWVRSVWWQGVQQGWHNRVGGGGNICSGLALVRLRHRRGAA